MGALHENNEKSALFFIISSDEAKESWKGRKAMEIFLRSAKQKFIPQTSQLSYDQTSHHTGYQTNRYQMKDKDIVFLLISRILL